MAKRLQILYYIGSVIQLPHGKEANRKLWQPKVPVLSQLILLGIIGTLNSSVKSKIR
jgi:hypothetical protein